MSRTQHVVRGAILLGSLGAIYACSNNADVIGTPVVNDIFRSYVAIGNSITAGYQSDGINDSTQRQSYAALLARQMGTRYAYPSLAAPGCAPPIVNALTQARLTPTGAPASTALTCALRNAAVPVPATLNNVAVPGFGTLDVTSAGRDAPRNNALAELILGGRTMLQKALEAEPTFTTIWIGNNDVLRAALGGLPGSATPQPAFATNYARMITELLAGAPGVKGVLIGVGQVSGLPILFQAGAVQQSAQVRAALSQVAGRPVDLDPNTCGGTNAGALVALPYVIAIAARPAGLPGTIFCQRTTPAGGATDPGDAGILDITEQTTVTALINGYNTYIRAKADSIGFAYFDPNPLFTSLKTSGAIPAFPNLASTTATFGAYISLDGVHPSATAHTTIANELIGVINTKYGTNLARVP
jgi:lysophospholipase L1-like esterase